MSSAPRSPHGRMWRLTGAAALLLGAVLAALVALPLIETSYATPGPQGSTNSNSATSGVGVAALTMGVLAAVCAVGGWCGTCAGTRQRGSGFWSAGWFWRRRCSMWSPRTQPALTIDQTRTLL